MFPLVSLQAQVAPVAPGAPPPAAFHDHGALGAGAPEVLKQMGYRPPPGFLAEGPWSNGAVARVGEPPVARTEPAPVFVLQPGWEVTLPPFFLGMMDFKRPPSVPVKVSSFCISISVLQLNGLCSREDERVLAVILSNLSGRMTNLGFEGSSHGRHLHVTFHLHVAGAGFEVGCVRLYTLPIG